MARLTEEMVVARTKQSDISQVTKLNCWGSELADVRLLRRMQNVEVLSLSVNKIRSLEDFQYCRNLVELFVRKNEIGELNQILYLQSLPRLRNLWLEENPCALEDEYRYTVLRALPKLQTLDKVPVLPEEVQDAMRRGRELVHPEATVSDEFWDPPDSECSPMGYQRTEQQQQKQQEPPSQTQQLEKQQVQSEPSRSSTVAVGIVQESNWSDEAEDTSQTTQRVTNSSSRRYSSSSQSQPTLARSPSTASLTQQSRQNDGSSVSQRSPPRCPVDSSAATFARKPSRDYIIRNADDVPVGGGQGQYYFEDDQPFTRQPQILPSQSSHHIYEEQPLEEQTQRVSNGGYHDAPVNQGDNSSSDGSGGVYRERSRPVSTVEDDSRMTYERNNRQTHERLSAAAQRLANDRLVCTTNQRAPYPRRPITRSSNLLSAVLCLVKELDYPSLEVVEMAVKCRMDELED